MICICGMSFVRFVFEFVLAESKMKICWYLMICLGFNFWEVKANCSLSLMHDVRINMYFSTHLHIWRIRGTCGFATKSNSIPASDPTAASIELLSSLTIWAPFRSVSSPKSLNQWAYTSFLERMHLSHITAHMAGNIFTYMKWCPDLPPIFKLYKLWHTDDGRPIHMQRADGQANTLEDN